MIEYWDLFDSDRKPLDKLHKRGTKLDIGEYHVVVQVWIIDDENNILISKRSSHVDKFQNLWQSSAAGSVISGDDSIGTAIKETFEEIGVQLNKSEGKLFTSYRVDERNTFYDVWVFRKNVELSDVKLLPLETQGIALVTIDELTSMIDSGGFIPKQILPYLDELFSELSTEISEETQTQ